jgi:hypoxanthine phosphoribosyltransferase
MIAQPDDGPEAGAAEAWRLLEGAELICPADRVQSAVERVAREITARIAHARPLVLAVMGGGVVFSGQLLTRLRFPLEFDFIHVTRYRGATRGGEITWRVTPYEAIRGRTVLVVDDILDEGKTLAAVRERILGDGAAACVTAVFCEKLIGRPKPIAADFVGITVPDRYVFGYGMDVHGLWRNLPEVYALRAR